jgi:hypothetical protein
VGADASQLLRLYFRHVHPEHPIISKGRFLRAYKSDKSSIPASLRGVVYGLGLPFWNHESVSQHMPPPCKQHELFVLARGSLECELDSPNLWTMQACLLIIQDTAPREWTFESARTWTLSAQAVACAQQIGLHRDPGSWKIALWEKSLRIKLWWATFAVHIWSAITNGHPLHIHDASFTTSDLSMKDLSFDEDIAEHFQDILDPSALKADAVSSAKFLEHVKLAQIAYRLLHLALYVVGL